MVVRFRFTIRVKSPDHAFFGPNNFQLKSTGVVGHFRFFAKKRTETESYLTWRWEWRKIGFCEKSVGVGVCEGEGAIFLSTKLIPWVLWAAARLKTQG